MQAGSGTALVVLASVPAAKPHPRRPAGADPRFLAQLLALGHDMPCQRGRRRAQPGAAIDAYRAAAALAPGCEDAPAKRA
jgi:hypothetical protein